MVVKAYTRIVALERWKIEDVVDWRLEEQVKSKVYLM